MGWSGGSEIMNVIIDAAKLAIEDEDVRQTFYVKCIKEFEMHDADTLSECLEKDIAFDEALREVNPQDFDEDEEDDKPDDDGEGPEELDFE